MIHYDLGVYLGPNIPHYVRNWRNDSSIREWCRQTGLITEQQQSNWLASISNNPLIKMYSINTFVENDENSDLLVGVCGLTSIDMTHRTAEFSLYIAPEYQKNGYAVKALKTLLIFAFKELGLNNVWGEVLEGNHALNIFNKVGFSTTGYMPDKYFKHGKFIGSTFIYMTKEMYNNLEWKQ